MFRESIRFAPDAEFVGVDIQGGEEGEGVGAEGETQTPQTTKEPEVSAEDRMVQKLQEIQNSSSESALMARLVADPDFRAVLEAKQRGEKFKIVPGDTTPKVEEEVDLDSLSPAKLSKYMLGEMEKRLGALVDSKLAPINQRLEQTSQFAQKTEQERVNVQVAAAKAKYQDFTAYAPDMVKLNGETNGTLTPEELYLISKTRKGKGVPTRTQSFSERPSSETTRPPAKKPGETISPGRRNMQVSLDEALKKLDINFDGE